MFLLFATYDYIEAVLGFLYADLGMRRSTSGRQAGTTRVESREALGKVFDAKEASDWLAARVIAANAPMYKGEQQVWGARPFNPVKDDFLHTVECALDKHKRSIHSEA